MTHYIDAEKLTKAIEDKGLDCSFALKMERLDTLALIDELQQEREIVELSFKGGTYRVNGEEHAFKGGKAKVIILDINQEEGNE